MRLAALLIPCAFLFLTGCARLSLHARRAMNIERPAPTAEELAAEAAADARFEAPDGMRNASAEFRALFHAPDPACRELAEPAKEILTQARLKTLRGCHVLLVHGLLGEVGIGVRRFLDKIDDDQGVLDYLKDQEEVLKAAGISFEHVVYRSHTVDRSGGKIAEAVLACEKPVLLLTHSKGSVDTLEALLKLDRAGQLSRVAGWISLQGPFYGSPQATRYVEHGGLRTFGIAAMRVMNADFDAVRDLTPAARAAYMDTHGKGIDAVVQRLPILCFTSWESPDGKEPEGKTGDEAPLTSAFRIQPESCLLPGCEYIGKAGVSHNDPVISGPDPFDRDAFTSALLAMLADRMAK